MDEGIDQLSLAFGNLEERTTFKHGFDEKPKFTKYSKESYSKLAFLDVSSCGIRSKGIFRLLKQLRTSKHLKELILDHNSFNEGQDFLVGKIGNQIAKNMSLSVLSMRDMNMNDDIASLLAYGLQQNRFLRVVNMSHNKIAREGAVELAIALNPKLDSKSQLLELYLNNNRIDEAGGN